MNKRKRILAGTGDPGGARALLPSLSELESRGCVVDLLDHGSIVAEAPRHWPRRLFEHSDEALQRELSESYDAYVFSTSVRDAYPLQVARRAREAHLPVICVLDNWMNYRQRLESDGQPMLLPEVYAVMDHLARAEAIVDGIPSDCLRVVGQPAIGNLADEYLCQKKSNRDEVLTRSGWADPEKKLLVFISEPVEHDQGVDAQNPYFRGYTEKTVLELLAKCLQPFSETIQLGLVPHPREDAPALLVHWNSCRSKVQGGQLAVKSGGRNAVFIADGVSGMASLLLYEAFLLGKPALSLQPNLLSPHLSFLKKKGVETVVTEKTTAVRDVSAWLENLMLADIERTAARFHPEMQTHQRAPSLLADVIEDAINHGCGETLKARL